MGQGAAIGLGSLFMQCNEACNKQSKTVRETILKVLKNEGHQGRNRGDTILRRQGALLGAGLLDAGGRNLLLQLRSPLHCMRREATLCVCWLPSCGSGSLCSTSSPSRSLPRLSSQLILPCVCLPPSPWCALLTLLSLTTFLPSRPMMMLPKARNRTCSSPSSRPSRPKSR